MEAFQLTIGEVRTETSFLRVQLAISDEGAGSIHVYSGEHSRNRSGYLILDADQWAALKEMIAQADATIARLKETGQLRYVAAGFRLAGE